MSCGKKRGGKVRIIFVIKAEERKFLFNFAKTNIFKNYCYDKKSIENMGPLPIGRK